MDNGPLSKRRKLGKGSCLFCNTNSHTGVSNVEFYQNLLIKYLIPPSEKHAKFEAKIFHFCTTCTGIVKTLSDLKSKVDQMLKKIDSTLDSLKFKMIMQDCSGDISIDNFRSLSVRDLKPVVTLKRYEMRRKTASEMNEMLTSLTAPKTSTTATVTTSKVATVRMDLNNILLKETIKTAEQPVDKSNSVNPTPPLYAENSSKLRPGGDLDKNYVSTADILASILIDSDISSDQANQANLKSEPDVENIRLDEPMAHQNVILLSEDKIVSQVINIPAENKEYPFLEQLEQFDPFDNMSQINDAVDPLDVQEESTIFRPFKTSPINERELCVLNPSTFVPSTHSTGFPEKTVLPKPSFTFDQLIILAIKNSKCNKLTCTEILDFISEHFPYYRNINPIWKGSVYRVLNHRNRYFNYEGRSISGAGQTMRNGWWSVNDSYYSTVRELVAAACKNNQHHLTSSEKLDELVGALYSDETDDKGTETLPRLPSEINALSFSQLHLPMDATGTLQADNISIANPEAHEEHREEMLSENSVGGIRKENLLQNDKIYSPAGERTTSNLISSIEQPLKVETQSELIASTNMPHIIDSYSIHVPPSQKCKIVVSHPKGDRYPTLTECQLAFLAIANSANKTEGNRQIIDFIEENFPAYQNDHSWKKGILDALSTNHRYFKRNCEQGENGPLVSWSIVEVEPHYTEIRLQIVQSLKESLNVNYNAAITRQKLEDIVRTALGTKFDLSFLKNKPFSTFPQLPKPVKSLQVHQLVKNGQENINQRNVDILRRGK